MSATKSVSEGWREKGNGFYRTVTPGLCPTLRVNRLQEAINCYSRALNTSANDDERSSACKNLAVANWGMAKAQTDNGGSSSIITFYFKDALSSFQNASDFGKDRDLSWISSLKDAAIRCWFDVRQRIDEWEPDARVRELHTLSFFIIDTETKATEYLEITNHYFNMAVTALGERNYQQSLSLLKDCYFPLKEAQKHSQPHSSVGRECVLLEEDIYTQTCVAESIQERVKGESLQTILVLDEEILNIDMIWEVVDSFRLAAHLTKDRDLELEAMALTSLGRVYDTILKMKDRAKPCLMKAIELANSMVPRNFSGVEWYEFARSTLQRYQIEKLLAEEDQHSKEREEVLKLIQDELDTLKKNYQQLTKLGFLRFVYNTHPPKNPNHKLGEVSDTPETGELKKLFQRAVIHYHPDKVSVEEHGKKWKVLTEEITKLLTSFYEVFKGFDPDPYKKK